MSRSQARTQFMVRHDAPYLLDSSLTPADEADVVKAIAQARQAGTPVYPIGSGTTLSRGMPPHESGVLLSLQNTNRVIDYPSDDMTITVEAGITIDQLAKTLAKNRQWLPVDVAHSDRATVGSAVAANVQGPRRFAHGGLRDFVLGLRAVDGSGMPFAAGGRVVKNAAGYNLCRVMVGSHGTLGVITQVTLMVRPLPDVSTLLSCEVEDLDAAERIITATLGGKTRPTAIELQAGNDAQDNAAVGPILESSVARFFVGFEGPAEDVAWMEETLLDEWQQLEAKAVTTIPRRATQPLWKWLTDYPTEIQIGVRPGNLIEMIGRLLRLEPKCSILAGAGHGMIRAKLPAREPADLATLLRERIRPEVTSAGGSLIVVSCDPQAELTAADVWGSADDATAVMRALKQRFDPDDLLNRGRFVFQES